MKFLFSLDDQHAFSELSGDYNPMHIDSNYARRLLFGSPVVHGVNSALKSLDYLLQNSPNKKLSFQELTFDFPNPIPVGTEVNCEIIRPELDQFKLALKMGNVVYTKVWGKIIEDTGDITPNPSLSSDTSKNECKDLSLDDIESSSGSIPLKMQPSLAEQIFPNLAQRFTQIQIAQILSTTYLVGMECPGLHSLFTRLNLKRVVSENGGLNLNYEVVKSDKRFSKFKIALSSVNMEGVIECFLRPKPTTQPSLSEVARSVTKNEFKDQRALIIGGSRGLGELTAKSIVAGGGEVTITYNTGKADALKLQEELKAGGGKCNILKLDLSEEFDDTIQSHFESSLPNYLYFYATPFIFGKSTERFSFERYTKFSNFYVNSFYRIVDTIARLSKSPLKVFYPSSSALDTYEKNMIEYSAAKAAGEYLCEFFNNQQKNVTILQTRLPRLQTDQTASITPVESEDALKVILEILRDLDKQKEV